MAVLIEQLPTLGVGASLSLSSKPDPVALVNSAGGPSFVEYAGLVDVEAVIDEVERVRAAGAPVLFHPSYINFCGSFANSSIWLEETARHIKAVNSPWFAQDCAYCFWQEGAGYSSQLGYFIPPIFNQNSLELAFQSVKEVQAVMSVPVAIEPPPLSFIAGTIPLFTFFGELSRATDCALLLDMGHLVSYEMASGRKVLDALDELPCDRVVEVHVAGGRLKKGSNGSTRGSIYVDAHECTILEETWQMFDEILPEFPNVKAVCYECEGVNENTVLTTLNKIRHIVKDKSASQSLLNCMEAIA